MKNSVNILVATLVLLAYYGKAQAQKTNCNGMVTNTKGAGLEGVSIRLEPGNYLTQTNNKGVFIIKQVYQGSYTLYASRIGYTAREQTIKFPIKSDSLLRIQLHENKKELQEVRVTALAKNSSPDNLVNIQRGAMPVTVITRQAIEKMGSRRLDEILKEQTGIAVVNDIGGGARATGVQIQGFGSEYIMVLIDGQPMTGRNSGNFDLSRITVANIERIEIVKGASSCLFGSEALGGAINIVTRHAVTQPQAQASLLYGSLNIIDATIEGETPFHQNRGNGNVSVNYYHSDGYNTDPGYIRRGTTAPPYDDYSVQGRGRYKISGKGVAGISGRYALRRSYMEKQFESQPGNTNSTGDRQSISDINLSAYYNHNFSSGLESMTRYYLTRYRSDMSVVWQQNNNSVGTEKFTQTIHRLEQQWAYRLKNIIKLTSGLGGAIEQMKTIAYRSANDMMTYFGYVQADWNINQRMQMLGGVRYDGNNTYNGRFNPSIGLQYNTSNNFSFKLSAGTGFKAPDFKNRYQVFVNPASNYMVIGTEVLKETLNNMQQNGEISEIRKYLLQQVAGNLKPEKSLSLNAGVTWKSSSDKFKFELSGFYHNLQNQINSIQVATGTGNRLIFTYQNLPKSFNTGIETSFSWKPVKAFEVNGGYQFLVAKDRSIRDSILASNYPWYKVRDNATGATFNSSPSDYWGIENRSRHTGNFRLFYHLASAGINFSFRINYRGRYPFGDANNNNFIDRYDQFVTGFFLLNTTAEKKLLKDHFQLRLTVDNILDYTDRLMPGQPGRIVLFGLSYRFFKER